MVQQLNNRNVTPRPTDNRDDMSGYSLRDILEMVFANWYWFFISIGFCMVVAASDNILLSWQLLTPAEIIAFNSLPLESGQ